VDLDDDAHMAPEIDAPPFQALKVLDSPEPSARTSARRDTSVTSPIEWIETTEGAFWQALVREMVDRELINALVRELALQAQLMGRDADRWHFKLERESLNQPSARERLKSALAAVGHAVEIGFEIGKVTDSPWIRHTLATQARQLAAQALIENDPMVQDWMRDFGAKIVPGSVKHIAPLNP
jgi:DNA polymerase-3 subunit gamma/tau